MLAYQLFSMLDAGLVFRLSTRGAWPKAHRLVQVLVGHTYSDGHAKVPVPSVIVSGRRFLSSAISMILMFRLLS